MNESIFRFVATEASSVSEEDLVIAAVESDTQYVVFQRSLPIGNEDDWGVHVEFDNQGNSGYEMVRRCELSRGRLRVEFTEPIGWQEKHSVAEVELQISDSEYASFTNGMRNVFTQKEELLLIQN